MRTQPTKTVILQSRVYKNNKIHIFLNKYLHISKKRSTFAPDLKQVTTKNCTKMKTLKQFKCESATIKMYMTEIKDNKNCLYIITEKPNKKYTYWHETEYKYWYSEEANKKLIQLIEFWCE